jgi:hypothetical protein
MFVVPQKNWRFTTKQLLEWNSPRNSALKYSCTKMLFLVSASESSTT